MNWREFWDGEHSIYVNARHKALHYARIAADIAALAPPGGALLDHGAGEALSSEAVAAVAARVYLYDAAPSVQDKLSARFAGDARIVVLSDAALAALAPDSLDAVIVNSLLQYVAKPDFESLLDFWRARLKPGGRLVLGDIIPPDVGPVDDVKALMGFAWRGGFVAAAMAGLVKTYFSPYRKLRQQLALTTYTHTEMARLLDAHGFDGAREARNIGHNQARMTFVAKRR